MASTHCFFVTLLVLYFRISSSSIAGKMWFFFFLVPGHQNKKEEDQFWRLETGVDLEIQTRGLISFFPYPSLLLPSPFLLSHLHPCLKNVGGEAQWDLWGSGGGVLRPLNDWNPPLVEDVSPNVELSILQSGLKTPILGTSKIPPMGWPDYFWGWPQVFRVFQ